MSLYMGEAFKEITTAIKCTCAVNDISFNPMRLKGIVVWFDLKNYTKIITIINLCLCYLGTV